MASEGEYDGVSVLADNSLSLEKVPAGADRILLYHLCNKGEITGGAFKHTSLEGKALMLDRVGQEAVVAGDASASSTDNDPAPSPGLEVSGAPCFLCVYRLASQKSNALLKSARRAGLYPHIPPIAAKSADAPKTVRSGALDVERWRLRAAQEEDEEFAPFITLLGRGERTLHGSHDRSMSEATLTAVWWMACCTEGSEHQKGK